MFPALLTTVFFSLSVIFASRSAKVLGGPRANVARITLAMMILGLWSHLFGQGLHGPTLPWFLISGVIGFGLGDISLFAALTRLGPRLAILLTQCLGAPFAAFVEWLWLGSVPQPSELVCGAVILVGVALALAPDHGWEGSRRIFWVGVIWGVGSALGQSLGAVFSRKAYEVATLAQMELDPTTAAYQRIIGGAVVIWLGFFWTGSGAPARTESTPAAPLWRRSAPLVVANALSGPVIGVSCFQWALSHTPTAIVLPIVATSPLVTMVFTFFLDGMKPTRRAVVGSIVAVAGAVLLKVVQTGR